LQCAGFLIEGSIFLVLQPELILILQHKQKKTKEFRIIWQF